MAPGPASWCWVYRPAAEPCAGTTGGRPQLRAHQAREFVPLRQWAMRRSAFYRRFHAGRSDRPPAELPVLTKAVLMEHFDEISTRSDLRLAEIERYRTDSSPQERSSAGTSGAPRRVRPVAVACSSDKIGLGEFDGQVPDRLISHPKAPTGRPCP